MLALDMVRAVLYRLAQVCFVDGRVGRWASSRPSGLRLGDFFWIFSLDFNNLPQGPDIPLASPSSFGLAFFTMAFLSFTEPFGFSFLAPDLAPFTWSRRLTSDVIDTSEAIEQQVRKLLSK